MSYCRPPLDGWFGPSGLSVDLVLYSVSCCLLHDFSSFLLAGVSSRDFLFLASFFLLLTSYSESPCRSRFLGIEPLLVC